MAWISINPIKKEIIYPILSFVMYTIYSFFTTRSLYYWEPFADRYMSISISLYCIIQFLNYISKSLAFILYIIQKKNSHHGNSNNTKDIEMISGSLSNKIKIIGMISIIVFFEFFSSLFLSNLSSITYVNVFDMIRNNIRIIIATIFSIVILHYKFYKHHWFSIFLMCFGLFLFIITAFYTNFYRIQIRFISYYNVIALFIYIPITVIMKGLFEVLEKYLIEVKYINSYAVIGLEGIIGIAILIALSMINLIVPKFFLRYLFEDLFYLFYDIFRNILYFLFFLSIIILSFLYHSFRILTIQHFFPTYTGLADIFGSFIFWIWDFFFIKHYWKLFYDKYEYKSTIGNKLIEFLCLIIMMIGILVYLEIIQLNVWGLGENTAYSISSRSESYYIKEINGITLAFKNDFEKEEIQ